MSLDSRLRDALRQATEAHDLREDAALQSVKATQPGNWTDLTVVALQDRDSPRAHHARAQRIIGALAACVLVAGAIALPVALRSRSRGTPRPTAGSLAQYAGCGPAVATGYRSTAVVRIGGAPSTSGPMPVGSDITLAEPVQLALNLCSAARTASHLRSDDPGIGFAATTNARGFLLSKKGLLLSLTVVTPTASGTTRLARAWATEFRGARIADVTRKVREQQHNLNRRAAQLHNELQKVDTQLAKLAPLTYGDVAKFDTPHSGLGHRGLGPPPVPTQGSTKLTHLALERVQILAQLSNSGAAAAVLRIDGIRPDVYAELVSQTPAVLIKPPHDSNTSTVLIAVGLLLGGVVLAGSAFVLGRRSRAPRPAQ